MALTLKLKLRILFVAVTLAFAGSGLFAVYQLSVLNAATQAMTERWLPRARIAEQLNTTVANYRVVEARHAMADTDELRKTADGQIVSFAGDVARLIGDYRALLRPGEDAAKLDAFERNWADYQRANEGMLIVSRAAQSEQAFALFREARPRFMKLSKDLSALAGEETAKAKAQSAAATRIYEGVRMVMIAVVAVMVLGAVGAAIYCERSVTAVLVRLAELMRRLAGGDYGLEVEGTGRPDEVGEMARAVEVFRTNGLEVNRLQGETETQRAATEEERRRNERTREAAAKAQAEVVAALAAGLDRLSGGDLTFRIETAFPEEYEDLRRDFNAAMQKLQETMVVVVENTKAIGSGAGEISQAADDLSKRTEQQAASLEETAAALDEITATVRKTAEGASHANALVGRARADAEQGGEVVGRAVDAMGGIQASSSQISQIIGVIDEIAFQTNLLALNAGVEAARAGDAGKGFAVVASEVRALAQRSAEAAKEIEALIRASSAQVGEGVELVAATGQALERIVSQVTEISGIVGEITASAQEQATGLHQVNTAVNQMDQVTQQNAAMVEQSTAASHALARDAEGLDQLMRQFNTGKGAAAAAPVRRPAAVAAPRYASGAATAQKLALVAQEDTWQEF
ncbi:HAMP domain-containing methyl-accepting chemotaxis protein [Phenylobacterium sp.]|uniref:HAMP domain-containing methyl-accepting chemotaxis protein n=1 Tax=Phenylobacterium sp. TaxID=1871053 RepID=UPI002CADFB03|nr:methyl-accepting chemotaxis protein [Phenylobacterium sp.]HVI32858.1 methyl-accepting chemotaxis protein [Phenylobacterium sp.]